MIDPANGDDHCTLSLVNFVKLSMFFRGMTDACLLCNVQCVEEKKMGGIIAVLKEIWQYDC
jgi:hypothetical protein